MLHDLAGQPLLGVARVHLARLHLLSHLRDLVGRQRVTSSKYFHMTSSGMDISLPNISSGGVGQPDVVAQALAHLLDAVGALEQRQGQNALRLLPDGPLQVAAGQQVELLVGAADLDVRLKHHRVVCLHQRVQELVQAERLLFLEAAAEVVALQYPGDRELAR